METKDILLVLGVGAVGYYLYSKSKNGMPLNLETTAPVEPSAPIPMPTAAPAVTTKYTYPEGIGKDGKKLSKRFVKPDNFQKQRWQ